MRAQGAQANGRSAAAAHDGQGGGDGLVHNLTGEGFRSAIDALFARTTAGAKFGLERTEELLQSLGNPHRRFKSIHIAGTNGKGSVVAMCDAMFRAKGLRVGRYTSPHLIDFRERILVNGEPISEAAVLKFLQRTTPIAEKIGATFFELTTALAFAHFDEAQADVAVIETGLGGRLDSTNVLTPVTATVTSIGLDHTDLLGDTLELIAKEKAGIFKPDVPAIIGDRNPEIISILRAQAAAVNASPIRVVTHQLGVSDVKVSSTGTSFVLDTKLGLRSMRTNLVGAHQAHNAAVAIATVRAATLGLEPEWNEIERGLASVRLPGRFQAQGKYIFDVAHNPAAAETLARTLIAVSPQRPLTAVISVLSDKDWRGVLRAVAELADRIILTNAPSAPAERRWDLGAADAFCRELGAECIAEPDLETALRVARDGAATVVVTGSFHTVGDSMSFLHVSPFAA